MLNADFLFKKSSILIYFVFMFPIQLFWGGTRWRSWLRHCAIRRKVAGLIPDDVIRIFHWHNPSGRIMALGSTQPLTEMSTRNFSWGVKAAGAYGWQPYHFHMPIVLKSGNLNLLEPSGPMQVCNGIALPLPFSYFETQQAKVILVNSVIVLNCWYSLSCALYW